MSKSLLIIYFLVRAGNPEPGTSFQNGGDDMKRIDRLEAKAKEKVKKKYGDSRDIDFSHLTDEELERESFKLEKLNYEDERSEHPDWTDEQIFQKLEDDLIDIMEE